MSRILIAHPARLAGRLQHEFAIVVFSGGLIASISFRKHVFVITHRSAAADRRAWLLVIVVRHVTALSCQALNANAFWSRHSYCSMLVEVRMPNPPLRHVESTDSTSSLWTPAPSRTCHGESADHRHAGGRTRHDSITLVGEKSPAGYAGAISAGAPADVTETAATAREYRRFSGVLVGHGRSRPWIRTAWLALPIDAAEPVSTALVVAGMVVTIVNSYGSVSRGPTLRASTDQTAADNASVRLYMSRS